MDGRNPEINLERSVVLQSAVNDFTLKLLSIDDRIELIWYVARKIVGDMGFADCVIYLLDQDTQRLRQIAAIGDKNPDGDNIDNRLEIPVGQGITGHVARSKQALIIDDLSKDDRYIPDKNPMLSEICVPLAIDGNVIGVIDCEDERRAYFTDQHLDMLQRIAEITSIKIKTIDSAEVVNKHAEDLQKANEELRHAVADHETTEKKLELSHTRLADFSSAASDWYWEQDADFRYTDASNLPSGVKFEFLESVIGRTRWEAMGADIVNDEHWHTHYEDHLAHRSYRDFRYSIFDDEGNAYYLTATGNPSFDNDGQFTGYRGIVSDITELVQTHNTNARFLQALDQTSEGLILWDKDEKLEICNMGFREMAGVLAPTLITGLTYETWLRDNLAHKLIPEAVGREEAWIQERLTNFASPTAPTELLRDGRWNLYVLTKLPDGSTIQRIIDINDLKLDRERFELATKGAGVGVWEKIGTTTDQAIWSDSYFEIFGLAPGEVDPSTSGFLNFVHNEDRAEIEKIIMESEAAGVEHDFECRIRRKDGTLAWVYSYGKLITVAGKPHWFGILVNIDKQKNAETAKNQFISTMNHELRTPLTAVIGLTDLLIEGAFGDISTQAMEMLALSKKNSDRLLLLINDILEIDRLKAGQVEFNIEPMSSKQILSDAIALNKPYANDFNVSLKNLGDLPFMVLADPNRIQQVFSNLISNAAKFSPAGSSVEISAKQDGEFGVFKVRDFGSGMPDDFREKAFKRFTQIDSSDTRQVGGSGLGLSITKSIVEIQGGEVDFETELGVGTSFWFSVPLASE